MLPFWGPPLKSLAENGIPKKFLDTLLGSQVWHFFLKSGHTTVPNFLHSQVLPNHFLHIVYNFLGQTFILPPTSNSMT